jgi:hypothetical protein
MYIGQVAKNQLTLSTKNLRAPSGRFPRSFLIVLAAVLLTIFSYPQTGVQAQTVSLTTLGTPYLQDFDTLSNTAGSTTNVLTINGWFLTEQGGGARDNEQYAVDTGGSTTGDMYSYGAAAATDRALGELRSGTLIPFFGASFTNNTGSTIAALSISYTGEEWRLGTAGRTDRINFEYSDNATDLITGTWTGITALNFVTPDTVTIGAKNGNSAGDRTTLSSTLNGVNIPNGATFWIRWTDLDATGADDGLSIDDFSLTPLVTSAASVSVSGRVATKSGRGIGNVQVRAIGPGGLVKTVLTSPFGYYLIDDLPAGQNYVISVSSKSWTFGEPAQTILLNDSNDAVNFIANN